MPTWTIPKALLDGCFQELAEENYSERIDKTVKLRALTHHLAHSLDSVYPNFGLTILKGVRKIFEEQFPQLENIGYDLRASPYASTKAADEMLRLCSIHLKGT